MNNKKFKNKKAFSLIELSIVILIIGIIVAGVTQSSRLISAFRLSTARSLTQSFPVASMKNLVMWLETTATASIDDSEAENGLVVTNWYDINPTSTTKYNASSSSTSRATYTTNCVNSLPCLRFDGSNDYYSYDGTFLVNTDYTVIVVEQRRASTDYNFFLGGTAVFPTSNQNLHLGYRSTSAITFAQYANDFDITISSYSSPTPRVHVFRFSSSTGKSHYLNGSVTNYTSSGATTGLTAYPNSYIGKWQTSTYFYNGDICEIIMFNRAITNEERDAIEVYLGKKWGITVS